MTRMILRTAEDFEQAARRSIFEQTPVALDIGISTIEERRIEERLNQLHAKCGCSESGIILVLLLAVSLTEIWTNRLSGSSLSSLFALSIFAFFMSGLIAGIAKFAAILYYRLAYRRQLMELAARLRTGQNWNRSNIH